MNCSTPGFPVLRYLLESAETHVHWVNDVIWTSHPLSLLLPSIFPSIRVFSDELAQLAKALELQLQHQSFQWIFRVDFFWNWLVCSQCSQKDSQESSSAPQLEGISSSALNLLYGPTLTSVHFRSWFFSSLSSETWISFQNIVHNLSFFLTLILKASRLFIHHSYSPDSEFHIS